MSRKLSHKLSPIYFFVWLAFSMYGGWSFGKGDIERGLICLGIAITLTLVRDCTDLIGEKIDQVQR